MLVLDTNVISEPMRQRPDEGVLAWLDAQARQSTWLTAVTVFELKAGIERLAAGKRKRQLALSLEAVLTEEFEGRILAFDKNAAIVAGELAEQVRRQGAQVEIRDLQIAAIAATHHAILATRNERDFLHTGITVINPWS